MQGKLVFIVIVILVGCAAALPYISQEDVQFASRRWPESSSQSLDRGRSLYIRHCSGCHSLHMPDEYTESEWKHEVEHMQDRSKLSDSDKVFIERFLYLKAKTR